MNDYTKPPLGAAPAYIAAEARIKELAEAIARWHLSAWAEEIIWQCEFIHQTEKGNHYKIEDSQ